MMIYHFAENIILLYQGASVKGIEQDGSVEYNYNQKQKNPKLGIGTLRSRRAGFDYIFIFQSRIKAYYQCHYLL